MLNSIPSIPYFFSSPETPAGSASGSTSVASAEASSYITVAPRVTVRTYHLETGETSRQPLPPRPRSQNLQLAYARSKRKSNPTDEEKKLEALLLKQRTLEELKRTLEELKTLDRECDYDTFHEKAQDLMQKLLDAAGEGEIIQIPEYWDCLKKMSAQFNLRVNPSDARWAVSLGVSAVAAQTAYKITNQQDRNALQTLERDVARKGGPDRADVEELIKAMERTIQRPITEGVLRLQVVGVGRLLNIDNLQAVVMPGRRTLLTRLHGRVVRGAFNWQEE